MEKCKLKFDKCPQKLIAECKCWKTCKFWSSKEWIQAHKQTILRTILDEDLLKKKYTNFWACLVLEKDMVDG